VNLPQRFAKQVNEFCANFLKPCVDFHRPCFFPETITDAKGKERKKYRCEAMMMPYDKLKTLPDADLHLKLGETFEQLDALDAEMSDNAAAMALNKARMKLFQSIPASLKKCV
jgi:hypothetical protein